MELFKEVKGDSTLFAGMLCYVGPGSYPRYQYLYDCLGADGQIWRNPEAATANIQYENSSSRDMFTGVLLAIGRTTLLDVADYLCKNDGLLCPAASDNRNRIGVMGWAQLGAALGEYNSWRHGYQRLGLKGFLLSKIFKPLLGPVTLLEALTVYEKYQLNLVYCALMLYRKNGIAKFWERWTLKVLRQVRNQDDMVLRFLEGDVKSMERDLPNLVANRERAVCNGELVKDWPMDNFGFHYPSAVYVAWTKAAIGYLNSSNTQAPHTPPTH